jgi:hypothetical protein
MNETLDLYQALERTDALGRLSWAIVSQPRAVGAGDITQGDERPTGCLDGFRNSSSPGQLPAKPSVKVP